MTRVDYQQAVEITRKFFFALGRTSTSPHSPKGVHEPGGFEAGVLTAIGIQRIQNEPDRLINDARRNVDMFDALRFAAAQQISLGLSMPPQINRWVSSYLQGKLERPMARDGKPSSEGMRRNIYGAVLRLIEMGMKPTRNDGSPPLSACDVVAEALRDLEMSPSTYGAVKKIYMEKKRGKGGGIYPEQFMIRNGRVIDTP